MNADRSIEWTLKHTAMTCKELVLLYLFHKLATSDKGEG